LNWPQLLADFLPWEGKIKLVGNLPYSISTPLLFKVLEHRELFPYIVFLLQREVAERISGRPGSKDYAPLSIFFQIYYEVRIGQIFSPACFSPPPKVESALLSLHRRPQPLLEIENFANFQNFLRACFRHRRKQLLKNLKLEGFEEAKLTKIFSELNLKPIVRPEEVDELAYFQLFKQLHKVAS
ncbi:MAG: ribosomal RNA small subunit methyltransferase A, partial [Candidatus Aminicenantes bacterium]|nr:ribosomal RNA small subunit methyltransferase A [Candidatus Aminicenantes bacterium]